MIKAISLFSGSGGLDLGFLRTGKYSIEYANDIDQKACETYRFNIGDHIECKDIAKLHSFPKANMIIGGPPCQGFSTGNPNRMLSDPRNWLFKEYIRILNETNPECFLFENVTGILSLERGKLFRMILSVFEDAGYQVSNAILNAANFGVPQNRKRVFIVGVRKDLNKAFRFPSAKINPPLFGTFKTVRDAILINSLNETDPNHSISKVSQLNAERLKHIPPGGSMKNCPAELQNSSDLNRAMRRLDPDKPSFTIVHNNCDHYYHPLKDRRITIREMALLQSYPSDFIFLGSKSQQSMQVGNSVPPDLSFEIAASIYDQIFCDVSDNGFTSNRSRPENCTPRTNRV